MGTSTPESRDAERASNWRSLSMRQLTLLGATSAALFALGLVVTETAGEFATDIDLKPFFIPYLLIVLFRYGIPTLSIGLGAAIGEGVLDIFEGYELDDPIGFLGYVVGFVAFGWYLSEVATDPTSPRSLTVASLLGAFVQAAFEGFAFLLFGPATGAWPPVFSVAGNTLTHGFVLGAVPLVVVLPRLRAWLDDAELSPPMI